LSGVLISIGDADGAAVNANILTNTEVLGHEGGHAILPEYHLAVEEGTLRHTGVDLLGFDHNDGLVFEEVVDEEGVNSVVLEAAFDDCLFEVAIEAEHLIEGKV